MNRANGADTPEYSNPGTTSLLLPTGRILPVGKGNLEREVIDTLTAEEADALEFYARRVLNKLPFTVRNYASVCRALTWIKYRARERKSALGQPEIRFRRRSEVSCPHGRSEQQ